MIVKYYNSNSNKLGTNETFLKRLTPFIYTVIQILYINQN